MDEFLPSWATLSECEGWLRNATGEPWPLPRILKHGVWPSAWIDYSPDVPAAVFERVFDGRAEGFLAPFCFAGDTHRMSVVRGDAVMTMTRSPRGELVRFNRGIPVALSELRFPGDKIRALSTQLPESCLRASQAPVGARRSRRNDLALQGEWQRRDDRQRIGASPQRLQPLWCEPA